MLRDSCLAMADEHPKIGLYAPERYRGFPQERTEDCGPSVRSIRETYVPGRALTALASLLRSAFVYRDGTARVARAS